MLNIITGANGGIGEALYKSLQASYPEDHFILTARKWDSKPSNKQTIYQELEAQEEGDYKKLAEICENLDLEIRFCINSIGVLEGPILEKPERKISEIDSMKLTHSFQINALPILLLSKYLFPFFRKSSAFKLIHLSAKLGSIADNELGGWYSYRLSKAASNMAVKNISIELQRYNPSACCISIHPGTCDTKFTKNFLESAKTKYKIHSPMESARNIISIAEKITPSDSGLLYNWDGKKLSF